MEKNGAGSWETTTAYSLQYERHSLQNKTQRTAMKRIIPYIIITATLLFSACDKVPENGLLDGLWQLMEIEDEGTRKDISQEHLYCSFQLKLFMLGDRVKNSRAYFGR